MPPCRSIPALAVGVSLVAGALLAPAAHAAETPARTPARYCRDVGTDDAPRPIPESLVPAAKRLFGLEAPDAVVRRATVFRCMSGAVLICTTGANLPCDKADTGRALAPAGRYCRENPDAAFVPAYVTGHDMVHAWRCRGTEAVAGEAVEALDARGFVARLWKPVE